MLYYLLGLALLLVVISWIYCKYPFEMTQGGHTFRGDFGPYSEQENFGRYLLQYTYKVLWSSVQSSCWSFCCSVFGTIAGLLIPSARSIFAGVAAIAISIETSESIRDNQAGTHAHQQRTREVYNAGENTHDDKNDVRPRDGRRKKRKKQKKRRSHLQIRLRNKDQAAHMTRSTIFYRPSSLDCKHPLPVEELLCLDREIAMLAVRRIDFEVGDALGNN